MISHNMVNVFYAKDENKLLVGKLALKDKQILFEYDAEFLKERLELSPFMLPLKPGIFAAKDKIFDGLFGLFNDSLPDGWGRLLLDRKLIKNAQNPGNLSPLDRLCYVGSHGMGALIYEPEIDDHNLNNSNDLDEIASEIIQFQEDDSFVENLLQLNGSSQGARPKIVTKIDGEDYIVKFRSSLDPLDMGAIEYAYHLMAQEAELIVPEARLCSAKKGCGYFAVKRFDRENDKRIHMHSLSGLIHADHRLPNLDYETIIKATMQLTKSNQECEKQFRLAVFNVLSHNRDDHSKNFSFLMDKNGIWKVSPAYDLTFSSGPGGEHCTTVMGEGKDPSLNDLLKLAQMAGVTKENARTIIDQVRAATAKWQYFAQNCGVQNTSRKMIENILTKVNNICN